MAIIVIVITLIAIKITFETLNVKNNSKLCLLSCNAIKQNYKVQHLENIDKANMVLNVC